MRLDRMLAECGLGTRNEVKKLIRSGEVTVNGVCVRKADTSVDEFNDEVCVSDEPVLYRKFIYLMLNKPAGYITATEGNVPVVMDLIGEGYRDLFPCGRLDRDTTGLLLITNDGQLAHKLLSPKNNVEKEYVVGHRSPLSDADVKKLESGITYGGESYRPAVYHKISELECSLIIKEGKYHEIKLMFEALGNEVVSLRRVRMKNLCLEETLRPGEYRELTEEEISELQF